MMVRRTILTIVTLSATLPAAAATHPPEFWKAIAKAEFAPPAGADVPALALELCDLFASPDPELRDDIGYSTFTAWVYQKKLLDAAALRPVTAKLLQNLRADIGSTGTDAIFRRSFSALALAVVAARDNVDAVLDERGFRELFDAALQYLDTEVDIRGYDPVKGWMHSSAHTADLIKFLARNRYITTADQARVLDAVVRKMTSSGVFVFGEDERHARVILSVINRQDFDRDGFAGWLARAKPGALKAVLPAVQELHGRQNVKNLLAKLEVLLFADPAAGEAIVFARDRVRSAIKDLF
jgi:hypothetical protein